MYIQGIIQSHTGNTQAYISVYIRLKNTVKYSSSNARAATTDRKSFCLLQYKSCKNATKNNNNLLLANVLGFVIRKEQLRVTVLSIS